MKSSEFIFSSPREIAIELASRAKHLRSKELKMTQKDFAQRVGMKYSTYQLFEQKGEIKLNDFIYVMQQLNRLDELTPLLKISIIDKLGVERS